VQKRGTLSGWRGRPLTSSNYAIFGGTFDPIHIGHLYMAYLALEYGGVEKVFFVPTADPPHKPHWTPFAHRFEMVRRAIENEPRFEVTRWEEDNRFAIYTWFDHGGKDVWYLLGSDSFNTILSWHRGSEVAARFRFLIVPRPGVSIDMDVLSVVKTYRILPECPIAVSSTTVRKMLRDGHIPKYLLPDAVVEYIIQKNLYRG